MRGLIRSEGTANQPFFDFNLLEPSKTCLSRILRKRYVSFLATSVAMILISYELFIVGMFTLPMWGRRRFSVSRVCILELAYGISVMFIREKLLGCLTSPQALANHLSQLPLSKRAHCVLTLLRRTQASPAEKELLLSLPEHITSDIIEGLREVRVLSRTMSSCLGSKLMGILCLCKACRWFEGLRRVFSTPGTSLSPPKTYSRFLKESQGGATFADALRC